MHLIVEIREDLLREKDGPMLLHALQGFQGSQILIPTRRDLPEGDLTKGSHSAPLRLYCLKLLRKDVSKWLAEGGKRG